MSTFTVYLHPFGGPSIPQWVSDNFSEALFSALEIADGAPLSPLDHNNVAVVQVQGKPASAWSLPDKENPDLRAIIFIVSED